MTSSSPRRCLVAAVLCIASLAASEVHAQPGVLAGPTPQQLETARTLYKEGKELRAHGDLRGALEKLQAAHALGNTPVTGIELARTYALVGQIAEAREVCLSIGRMPVASDETEKSADARAEAVRLAEELRPRIPTLTVKALGLGPGERAHLVIDGVAVPDAAMGEPQKVDPGAHTVTVRTGEGPTARESRLKANVTEGQSAELTVPLPVAPAAFAPVGRGGGSNGASTVLVRAGFATAIAGGAVGLLTGLTALNKKDQLSSECPNKGCPASNGSQSDLATAKTWGDVSTVAFVVGGVAAAAGIAGLWMGRSGGEARDASVSPWLGVGAAGVHGRF